MENISITSTTVLNSQEKEPHVEKDSTMDRPNWSSLPLDIVTLISEELPLPHRICFHVTCNAWYFATMLKPIPSPLLLVRNDESEHSDSCLFVSPITEFFFIYFPINELHGTRCVGSNAGWLAILDEQLDVSLLNLLTKTRIYLPSFITSPLYNPPYESKFFTTDFNDLLAYARNNCCLKIFRDFIIKKVVFSSKPTIHSYIAMILYGIDPEIAYTKAGNDKWIFLGMPSTMKYYYEDIMYHDGKFYSITNESEVQVFDLSGDYPVMMLLIERLAPSTEYLDNISGSTINDLYNKYLACSSTGEMFLILWYRDHAYYPNNGVLPRPKDFMLMKVKPETSHCWATTKDMGNMCLFIGSNNPILIPSKDLEGLKGDHIFSIETFPNEEVDRYTRIVGCFDLKEERLESFSESSQSPLYLRPPIWFTLSLH
ncbi:F-box protein KIB4-like [Musa acuminata AAA Group]|uniref:F-box protein KIB4-like n=1 Tax=Musa acuminata AAA Group TaxID=214697 RepID=UPI0031D093CF